MKATDVWMWNECQMYKIQAVEMLPKSMDGEAWDMCGRAGKSGRDEVMKGLMVDMVKCYILQTMYLGRKYDDEDMNKSNVNVATGWEKLPVKL